MTKYHYLFVSLLILVLTSCQTIEELSIDYMVPASISFPSELKRVAIVNNVPSNGGYVSVSESPKAEEPVGRELKKATVFFDGNAQLASESLAESLSKANYFDEVVICDSVLRSKDILPREATLSQVEVKQLAKNLDVDAIISIEGLKIKAVKGIQFLSDWGLFQSTTDAKIFSGLRIYIPSRKVPMVTVNVSDSIYWEETGTSEASVLKRSIDDKELVKEASDFAGTIPVKYLTPYWKTANRFIYTNGSVEMRDAAIYVKEKSWDKAHTLWEKAFQSKNKKRQMRSALNIALYYEMNDSLQNAEKWALKAQSLAREVEKVDEKTRDNFDMRNVPNYYYITLYVGELQERLSYLPKLNMQMNRFNDDF